MKRRLVFVLVVAVAFMLLPATRAEAVDPGPPPCSSEDDIGNVWTDAGGEKHMCLRDMKKGTPRWTAPSIHNPEGKCGVKSPTHTTRGKFWWDDTFAKKKAYQCVQDAAGKWVWVEVRSIRWSTSSFGAVSVVQQDSANQHIYPHGTEEQTVPAVVRVTVPKASMISEGKVDWRDGNVTIFTIPAGTDDLVFEIAHDYANPATTAYFDVTVSSRSLAQDPPNVGRPTFQPSYATVQAYGWTYSYC